MLLIGKKVGANKINLEDLKAQHVCFSRKCRICHEDLKKGQTTANHACLMQRAPRSNYYSPLLCFDIESMAIPPDQQHLDVCLTLQFEMLISGNFASIVFTREGFYAANEDQIQLRTLKKLYLSMVR